MNPELFILMVTFPGCVPGADARCPRVNAMRGGDRTRAEGLSHLKKKGK